MYISEVAPLRLRGALGVCNQLSVTAGLLVAQLLGADFGLGRWDVLLGLSVVPCIVQLVLLPPCPESPRYLLLTANREAQAVQGESRYTPRDRDFQCQDPRGCSRGEDRILSVESLSSEGYL